MDDLELIRNKNEFEISIKSFNGEMEACQEKAHMQFRHKIMVPYDPYYGEVVGEKCLGCSALHKFMQVAQGRGELHNIRIFIIVKFLK